MATSLCTPRLVGIFSKIIYIGGICTTAEASFNLNGLNKLWSLPSLRRISISTFHPLRQSKFNIMEDDSKAGLATVEETIKNGADVFEIQKCDGQDVKDVPIKEEVNLPPPQERREYLRRKKMVLMLSYCGQDYLGMQRNPGMKTIEDDLLKSLLKAGYIDEEGAKMPRLLQFQRAARTDKHVSAARQIVSLKMPDTIDIPKLNSFLPEQVRVMGVKKVTKGFDCKTSCDARTYMYMIPTFAFVPIDGSVTEDYRISPEVLESLRTILGRYLGTRNFHNFTSRRKPTDPSSKRYIISFTASEPFVKDGLEYLILRVKGQSFMMHQIRKMIGLVVAYMRGFAGEETFTKAWNLERIDIPKAPGVGLVLDHVHYERYNKRYGSDGMHSILTWDEVNNQVEEFCQTYIYPVITKSENESKSMFEWLTTLPYHTYDIREQHDINKPAGEEDLAPIPKEFSKIGQAGLAAQKDGNILGLEDDEDGVDDDSDDDVEKNRNKQKRGPSAKVESGENKDDDGDDDDNEFVQGELAKRKKLQ